MPKMKMKRKQEICAYLAHLATGLDAEKRRERSRKAAETRRLRAVARAEERAKHEVDMERDALRAEMNANTQ